MEVREFKNWLNNNNLDNNELFQESIKCYQVEAYKAAYMYSYLATLRYINEIIVRFKGIPKNFKKGKDEELRNSRWRSQLLSMQDENKWEQETFDLVYSSQDSNIFGLKDEIRHLFQSMRVLRNTSAHVKNRNISEETVRELWNNIVYMLPYFRVDGTIEKFLEDFEDKVRYGTSSSELIQNLIIYICSFSRQEQSEIISRIIENYIIKLTRQEQISQIVIDFLAEYRSAYPESSGSLLLTYKIYLFLLISQIDILSDIYEEEILKELKMLSGNVEYIYFCRDNVENFWSLIDYVYNKVNKDSLIEIVDLYSNEKHKILDVFYEKYSFFESKAFFDYSLKKIIKLYNYETSEGIKNIKTFNVKLFNDYKYFIKFLFYYIKKNPDTKDIKKVKNFLKRCETLLFEEQTDRLSGKLWMRRELNLINNQYCIFNEQEDRLSID